MEQSRAPRSPASCNRPGRQMVVLSQAIATVHAAVFRHLLGGLAPRDVFPGNRRCAYKTRCGAAGWHGSLGEGKILEAEISTAKGLCARLRTSSRLPIIGSVGSRRGDETGKRSGLKIRWVERPLWVQVPPPAPVPR